MLPPLPWIITLAVLATLALLLLALGLLWKQRAARAARLPTEWKLTARPVFNIADRRMYRRLREALPQQIVLSKLPLVRFCQPTEPQQVRYWFDLLGAIHVTFAVCSANGRVLAAIDLDTDNSRRAQQIKQSVLAACRIRYLRCPADQLPSTAELQLLVPQSGATPASATSRSGLAARRSDSGFSQGFFFGGERRSDTAAGSEFGSLGQILRSGVPAADKNPPQTDGDRDARRNDEDEGKTPR